VRLSLAWGRGAAVFDDENLVSCAGLVPVMELAEQTGLSDLLDEHAVFRSERIRSGAANPAPKLTSVIAGLLAGADSIDDLDLIRAGGMNRLFRQVYAPATLGILLREFTGGHVRQLDAVLRRHLLPSPSAPACWTASPPPERSWTSTRCSARSTDTPNRAPRSGPRRSRTGTSCAKDCPRCRPPSPPHPVRRCWPDPAPRRQGRLRQGRCQHGHRGHQHRESR
jgi:hypothetical protein